MHTFWAVFMPDAKIVLNGTGVTNAYNRQEGSAVTGWIGDMCDVVGRSARRGGGVEESINDAQVTIRRATRADIPAIVHLLADDPLGQRRERDEDPVPVAYYDAFARIDGDLCNELVVVEMHGEVIGTLQLTLLLTLTHQARTRAQIEAVRVDLRYRSQGMGHYLFVWAIERARQEGCHIVQLTTNASRDDAHRFYACLGFVMSHIGMKLDLTQPSAVAPMERTMVGRDSA